MAAGSYSLYGGGLADVSGGTFGLIVLVGLVEKPSPGRTVMAKDVKLKL